MNGREVREATPVVAGARRRAGVRAVLGKPGSVRRWVVGSLSFVGLCALVFGRVGYLGRIAVFVIAAVVVMTAWRARSLVEGDEDELRAGVRRAVLEPVREVVPDTTHLPTDEEWEASLLDREGRFGDAPPPPILDATDHA